MFCKKLATLLCAHTLHARFLADRGFDDKWVHKEERKKDIWEEVKSDKKKQMSGAEKRARAAKISAQTLKNADAVRVDVDGQVLNKLLEKQARKEGMGERGQEPKPAPSAKPKKAAAAAAPASAPHKEKEAPFVTSVPLTARRVRSELASYMAQHENTYARVIALSELVHQAFEPYRIDLKWDEHVGLSSTPKSWLKRPCTLIASDTIDAIVEWLNEIAQKDLAEVLPLPCLVFACAWHLLGLACRECLPAAFVFVLAFAFGLADKDGCGCALLPQLFEFLVEHAMPGGGKHGRGGEQPYLGLKALLQVMLQRVRGAGAGSWHDAGARLGAHVAMAEVRGWLGFLAPE